MELKNIQNSGTNFIIFNHSDQPSTQFPPVPPKPHPDVLNTMCSICQQNIDDDPDHVDAYIEFNCKHKFHFECCGKWCAEK